MKIVIKKSSASYISIGNTTVREELMNNTTSAKHEWYFSLSSNTSGIIQ